MGAWGLGLQANDTALDAIGNEKRLIRAANTGGLLEYVNRVEVTCGDIGVLGVGEWLLDNGFSVGSIRPILERAIENEMRCTRLDSWNDPKGRQRVLELFRDRLAGKPVPQEEIDASNEGLLSKIGDLLGGKEDFQ